MTAHIHAACIIALAEDTTRKVWVWGPCSRQWVPCVSKDTSWYPDSCYRVLDADGTVVAETPKPKPLLHPADAVCGFAGWLTGREEAVTMGAHHLAAPAAELVKLFLQSQGLEGKVSPDYPDSLQPYPVETPAPKPRRVRIEWDGPAPVAYARDALFFVRLNYSEGRWTALRSDGYSAVSVDAFVAVGLAFAAEEDAQQWADFLNQKWEVVGDE